MAVIDDHIIEPRISLKKVEKGFKRIEQLWDKVGKVAKQTANIEEKIVSKTGRLRKTQDQLRYKAEKDNRLALLNQDIRAIHSRRKEEDKASLLKQRNDEKLQKQQRKEFQKQARDEVAQIQRKYQLERREATRLHKARTSFINNIDLQLMNLSRARERAFKSGVSKDSPEMRGIESKRAGFESMRGDVLGTAFNLKAVEGVSRQYRLLAKEASFATRDVNTLSTAMRGQFTVASALRDSVKNLARSYVSAFAVIAGTIGSFRAGEELETVRATLLASSGTAKQAAKDWEFVSKTAMTFGSDFQVLAKGFNQINLAAKTANLTTAQSKSIFLSAVEGATAFGLSMDDQQGVIKAFSQILSKGTVSMEELKSQLGDRMPVAMSLAAKSMKMTVPELIKMVETGKLISTDFIIPFSDAIRTMVRETGALEAALQIVRVSRNRFMGALKLGIDKAFQVAAPGLVNFFDSMAMGLQENSALFETFGKVVGGVAGSLGYFIDIASSLLQPFNRILKEVNSSINNVFSKDVDRKLGPWERGLSLIAGLLFKVAEGWMRIAALMEGSLWQSMKGPKALSLDKPGELLGHLANQVFSLPLTLLPNVDAKSLTGFLSDSVERDVLAQGYGGKGQSNIQVNVTATSTEAKVIADEVVDAVKTRILME